MTVISVVNQFAMALILCTYLWAIQMTMKMDVIATKVW